MKNKAYKMDKSKKKEVLQLIDIQIIMDKSNKNSNKNWDYIPIKIVHKIVYTTRSNLIIYKIKPTEVISTSNKMMLI